MTPAVTFTGFCDDAGKFALDNRRAFLNYIAAKFKGHEVVVTVTKKVAKRTVDQNAYWWAVPVKIMAAELGYTDNQMHYALLGEHGGYKVGPTGQPVPNIASITDLNREQMAKLIDWVLDWAPSELNITIPPPDPKWKEKREKERQAVAS